MGNKSSSPLPSLEAARAGLDDSEMRHIEDVYLRYLSKYSSGGNGIGIATFVDMMSYTYQHATVPDHAPSSSSSKHDRGATMKVPTARIGLPSLLEKLLSVADTKRDGVIDLEEFISVVALFRIGSMEDKIKLLFCMYEPNKNGYLFATSLKQLIVDALVVSNKEQGHAEAQLDLRRRATDLAPLADCMAEMALHQYAATAGKISFEEFASFVKVEGSVQALLQLLPDVVDR